MDRKPFPIFRLALVGLVVLGLTVSALGQGRPGGNSGSRGPSSSKGGPPSGAGVDRGIGNSSSRSDGRADDGRGNASERSGGRSDAGLDRARLASNRLRDADRDLREHPGIAHTLKVNANDLRSGYQAALMTNPDLKFGQYVAAERLQQNLGSRHPNITRDAILGGLASGRSLGRTLQDLGLSEHESSEARKRVEREIKKAKKKN